MTCEVGRSCPNNWSLVERGGTTNGPNGADDATRTWNLIKDSLTAVLAGDRQGRRAAQELCERVSRRIRRCPDAHRNCRCRRIHGRGQTSVRSRVLLSPDLRCDSALGGSLVPNVSGGGAGKGGGEEYRAWVRERAAIEADAQIARAAGLDEKAKPPVEHQPVTP